MGDADVWWLTAALAFIGPLVGYIVGVWINSRDRISREDTQPGNGHDRAERRRGYLCLVEAAAAFEPAVAQGRGEQALADLRRAASIAVFDSDPGIESCVDDLVEAGRSWIRITAAHSPSSVAAIEAADAFRQQFSAARTAMRADIATLRSPAG
jgi:hypothetical protein